MTDHPPTEPTPGTATGSPFASPPAGSPGSPLRATATASEAAPDVSGSHSAEAARSALLAVRAEVAKAVVGQDAAVAGLLVALLCRGHILLEGVPGVAKTLLVRALAAALDVDTKRVQFTPDLMPGDLTGSLVFDTRTSDFTFREGPVFTNLLVADEINRTPPKTQSALLEAMEERQVSIDGRPHALPGPFLVAATQNPVEYEGTYPLPEAQLDRFVLKVVLPTPERVDEIQVLRRHASGFDPRDLAAAGIRPVASTGHLDAGAAAVRQVSVSDEVAGYSVDIARATRVSPSLSLGVSPRGATALLATSRAWAWLAGRTYVTPDDVKALAHATLGHRLSLRPEAELEGVGVSAVLDSALGSVPVPR
ncbi:MAG: AAA family ATPase [Phycicoccus sp.]